MHECLQKWFMNTMKCEAHTWGPMLYSPVFTGKLFCFSPPEHKDRFVRFCKECGRVESLTPGESDEWKIEKSLLSFWECLMLSWERDEEVVKGLIEKD